MVKTNGIFQSQIRTLRAVRNAPESAFHVNALHIVLDDEHIGIRNRHFFLCRYRFLMINPISQGRLDVNKFDTLRGRLPYVAVQRSAVEIFLDEIIESADRRRRA